MDAIRLTNDGDYLLEYPSEKGTNENDAISCCVGLHQHCNGWVDKKDVTEKYDVLLCRACCLRIKISKTIKTYKQLRLYIEKTDDFINKGSTP